MMINKRLINSVEESKGFIKKNIFSQWLSLLSNIGLMMAIAIFIERLFYKKLEFGLAITLLFAAIVLIAFRFFFTVRSSKMSFLSSKSVKISLRKKIYEKLLSLGASYKNHVNTSSIVQLAVEGVDQLESYFSSYLPQFFYSLLAPLSLFIILSFISFSTALILFVCVPLIPISIALVQTWAKKLLSRYWGQYTALGDSFLENLQGLTTLKVFKADEAMHKKMNQEAEHFRKITMKVLTMQLNSISIMDLVAYGGAALGMIMAISKFNSAEIGLGATIFIILISADFFLPMRLLGSFFHIAMNGMAASDKIFQLLDIKEEDKVKALDLSDKNDIKIENLSLSYDGEKEAIKNISLNIDEGSFVAIVGESGSGKSTLAKALSLQIKKYDGDILLGGVSLKDAKEDMALSRINYLSHKSYIFKGTIRENLLIANKNASDEEMFEVIKKVRLDGFVSENGGLDFEISEQASNISGGQRQRLAFARALLADSPIYIFDEATSNIDSESENAIMEQIFALHHKKTVILISHRLYNVIKADKIALIKDGCLAEEGTHSELLNNNSEYARLYNKQKELEDYLSGDYND